MLYLYLVPPTILLIVAHVAARPDPQPVRWAVFLRWGGGTILLSMCFLLPSAFAMFFLLVFGLAAWPSTRQRLRTFLPYSLAAFAISYGVAFWPAWEAVQLRAKYPFESMVERVPEPRRGEPGGSLTGKAIE